jgi:hypothetical protein
MFPEIKAARLVSESLAPKLIGKVIRDRTNNEGTQRIATFSSISCAGRASGYPWNGLVAIQT